MPNNVDNKAKLLLVYPPISRMERYGSKLGIFGGKQIPLGLYSLAAYVRQSGYQVDALDAEAQNLTAEDILERIKSHGYTVLGISSTTVAFHRAKELAELVKRFLPEVTTVIGGPHVSSQPEQPLTITAFDYAIRNEGELTLVEFLDFVENGGDPNAILGLIHRWAGEIVVNPKRPYIRDLDALPFPAFDLIPDLAVYSPPPFNYRARPVANVITSRGCPNECTFCERTTFGRTARKRSAENIVDEIEDMIVNRGVREIAFVDDTFTIWPKRIHEIFELAGQRGLKFLWTCMSRVNTVDRDLLTYMRDKGCWYIAFGIESGDENVLREIKKNIKLDDVRRVIGICSELGIVTKGFFIIGHPLESLATIDKTIDFACEIPLDHIVVTINTPMPGSHQYLHAKEFGDMEESDWKRFNYWNPVFVPFGLTREQLLQKQQEFLRKFYLRPKKLLRNMRRMCLDSNSRVQLKDFLVEIVRFVWLKAIQKSR